MLFWPETFHRNLPVLTKYSWEKKASILRHHGLLIRALDWIQIQVQVLPEWLWESASQWPKDNRMGEGWRSSPKPQKKSNGPEIFYFSGEGAAALKVPQATLTLPHFRSMYRVHLGKHLAVSSVTGNLGMVLEKSWRCGGGAWHAGENQHCAGESWHSAGESWNAGESRRSPRASQNMGESQSIREYRHNGERQQEWENCPTRESWLCRKSQL